MNRRISLVIGIMLQVLSVVRCSSTTSSAPITCPGTQKPCGIKFCYDPATQICSETGSIVTCINVCGNQCYDSAYQVCINGTICKNYEALCEVKYDIYGDLLNRSQPHCYEPAYKTCINYALCYGKDRVCNKQCIPYSSQYNYQLCANDNMTLCKMSSQYTFYQPNQIQVCNGTCYDTDRGLKHCVNGSVQCVSNCAGVCYNSSMQVCINGAVCYPGQDACLTSYDSRAGYPLSSPQLECYNPLYQKCINDALCSNARICNGHCITGNNAQLRVCANDRRTVCNVTNSYSSYGQYQIHLCNGICYDTSFQQCVNNVISCVNSKCGNQCYDSYSHVCINGVICSIGQNSCEVKYSIYGNTVEPSQFQCWNPSSQICLNNTLCGIDRVCNGQCIPYSYYSQYNYQVCASNNVTLCTVSKPYTEYKPNQIQTCNGTCFDRGNPPLRQCIQGTVQCISNCSNQCYYTASHKCINGFLCPANNHFCQQGSQGICYDPLSQTCLNGTVCPTNYHLCQQNSWTSCYDPQRQTCLNSILCNNDRVCDGKCLINTYQVCANDKHTVCNVTKPYNNYRPNQIHLCLGACFDSTIQQCSGDHVVLCIHDPVTQLCVPQNVNTSTPTSTILVSNYNHSIVVSTTTIVINGDNSSMQTTTSLPISTSTMTSANNLNNTQASQSLNATTILTTFTTTPFLLTSTGAMSTTTSSSSSLTTTQTSTTSTTTILSTISSSSTTVSTPTSSPSSIVTNTLLVSTTSTTTTQPISSSTISSTTLLSQTTSVSSTTATSSFDGCCARKECTTNADCCVSEDKCQCFRHNITSGYGSCLNPTVKPICADGCPDNLCLSDTDCCRCQCASITIKNVDGSIITKNQCLPR